MPSNIMVRRPVSGSPCWWLLVHWLQTQSTPCEAFPPSWSALVDNLLKAAASQLLMHLFLQRSSLPVKWYASIQRTAGPFSDDFLRLISGLGEIGIWWLMFIFPVFPVIVVACTELDRESSYCIKKIFTQAQNEIEYFKITICFGLIIKMRILKKNLETF